MPTCSSRPRLGTASNLDDRQPAASASPDAAPQCPPCRPELASQPVDRGMLGPELSDRPPARSDRQQAPRPADPLVLLGEGSAGTDSFAAPPGPFPPQHPNRPTKTRRIGQHHRAPASAGGDHPTHWATRWRWRRLHRHGQTISAVDDLDDVQTGQADQQITAITVGSGAHAAAGARRRLRHRRGPRGAGYLVVPDPEDPDP